MVEKDYAFGRRFSSKIDYLDPTKLKAEADAIFNLEERCGFNHKTVFHFWIWLCILDAIGKVILYETDLVYEHFNVRKGILSMHA